MRNFRCDVFVSVKALQLVASLATILGLLLLAGCGRSLCDSMRDVVNDPEVRVYLEEWIAENLYNQDLEARFFYVGGAPGEYGLRVEKKALTFRWELLQVNPKLGEIRLIGENLDSIEAVYFGEGFRRGIVVSLRNDRRVPLEARVICYESNGFAVFFDDGQ